MADTRPRVWVSQPLFDDVIEQLGQHVELAMTREVTRYTPVSYTHLTLPTNREV